MNTTTAQNPPPSKHQKEEKSQRLTQEDLTRITELDRSYIARIENGKNTVFMTESEFNSIQEMLHLTSSAKNINAINDGIKQLKNHEGVDLTLDDLKRI